MSVPDGLIYVESLLQVCDNLSQYIQSACTGIRGTNSLNLVYPTFFKYMSGTPVPIFQFQVPILQFPI